MGKNDNKEEYILELCSEGECGSWEFWSSENKTDKECDDIVAAIVELVNEKKIIPLEYEDIKNQSYKEGRFDRSRLEREVRQSMKAGFVNPDDFYWFMTTEDGKKEDLQSRSRNKI